MLRAISNLMVALLTLSLLGMIAGVALYMHISKDLPDYRQLAKYEPPVVTRLYAGNGLLLNEYATENRVYVPISAIPKRVTHAFIAAEDQNFYTNPGIDFGGIMRAAWKNVTNRGRSLAGGSTITQQVVKNFLLTSEKSITRKIKEAILAFRISNAYTKDRILELYLNQIYLGKGAYGVAAGALNYFNKSLDELTIEEAAFLAALPKAPANYDPRNNYEAAKTRRDWVIGRMYSDDYITKDELIMARATPIQLLERDKTEIVNAPYFAEEVRREIAKMYGTDALYKGGLVVRTTIDPTLQKYAEAALWKALTDYDRRHGYRGAISRIRIQEWQQELSKFTKPMLPEDWRVAVVLGTNKEGYSIGLDDGEKATLPRDAFWGGKAATAGDVILVSPLPEKKNQFGLQQVPLVNGGFVAMDPHTGRVLALVGGGLPDNEFNRATQALRQPGSAFKPFVYMSALENGFTPASIVLDAPISLSQGAGLPAWTPKNYKDDYLGPVSLRTGLEKSRNTMTVRLAVALGIDRILEVSKRFGIYPNPQRNFSIVLGAAETTLLDLTNAYAMLAAGGRKLTPAIIERIQDRQGRTIFRRDTRPCEACALHDASAFTDILPPEIPESSERVTDPRIAYQITALLQGVVERGTAAHARKLGWTLAGKTGTTNDSRDAWFVGFSPDLVAGLYIGFDQPRTLGAKETGASATLPGWEDFMSKALEGQPSVPFRIPPGLKLVRTVASNGETIFEPFLTGDTTLDIPWIADMLPKAAPKTEAAQEEITPDLFDQPGITSMPPETIVPQSENLPAVGTGGLY